MAETFTPITTQEEFDSAIKQRLLRERANFADYEDLKKKAESVDAKEAEWKRLKAEADENLKKANAQLDEALKKMKGYETDRLRTEIAIAKGIPLELRTRLAGETKEDIEKDADELQKILSAGNNRGLPGFTSGDGSGDGDKKNAAYKTILSGLIKKGD